MFSDGEEFDAELIVWTAGNAANPVVANNTDLPVTDKGLIIVRADLRIGTPDGPVADAWSAGDAASIPDVTADDPAARTVPNAQHAYRQGRQLARNIAAVLRGQRAGGVCARQPRRGRDTGAGSRHLRVRAGGDQGLSRLADPSRLPRAGRAVVGAQGAGAGGLVAAACCSAGTSSRCSRCRIPGKPSYAPEPSMSISDRPNRSEDPGRPPSAAQTAGRGGAVWSGCSRAAAAGRFRAAGRSCWALSPPACLVVLIVTGVFLTIFYTPSSTIVRYQGAYPLLRGVEMSEAYASTHADLLRDPRRAAGPTGASLGGPAAPRSTAAPILMPSSPARSASLDGGSGFSCSVSSSRRCSRAGAGTPSPTTCSPAPVCGSSPESSSAIPLIGTALSMLIFGGEFPGTVVANLYPIHVIVAPAALVLLARAASPRLRAGRPSSSAPAGPRTTSSACRSGRRWRPGGSACS